MDHMGWGVLVTSTGPQLEHIFRFAAPAGAHGGGLPPQPGFGQLWLKRKRLTSVVPDVPGQEYRRAGAGKTREAAGAKAEDPGA